MVLLYTHYYSTFLKLTDTNSDEKIHNEEKQQSDKKDVNAFRKSTDSCPPAQQQLTAVNIDLLTPNE